MIKQLTKEDFNFEGNGASLINTINYNGQIFNVTLVNFDNMWSFTILKSDGSHDFSYHCKEPIKEGLEKCLQQLNYHLNILTQE